MRRSNVTAEMNPGPAGPGAGPMARPHRPPLDAPRRAGSPNAAASPTALIVEPKSARRATLRRRLEREGFAVSEAEDGLAGWKAARRQRLDLVVAALQLRGLDGIDLLKRVRSNSDLPFIFHTTVPDLAAAVEATKLGAQDVLLLPADLERLVERARALAPSSSVRRLDDLERGIVGKSSRMQRVRERVLALASLRVPVLVHGEAGTGRDHVVRTLHAMTADCSQRLVVIRGSESSPIRDDHDNGVFYLDHFHSFTRAAQSYWLQKLNSSRRGRGPRRIYASTTENLHALCRDDGFDAALAAEIGRFPIELPPLRERIDDLADLSRTLASKAGSEMGKKPVRFTSPALAALRSCAWPGNLRELETVIEKLVAFAQDGRITRDHVRSILNENSTTVTSLRRKNEEEQRRELVALLRESGGNLAEAARRLDMSRGAIIYRAKKFGLLPHRSKQR